MRSLLSLLIFSAFIACTSSRKITEASSSSGQERQEKKNVHNGIEEYFKLEYLKTRNPATGKMEYEKLADAFEYMKAKRSSKMFRTDTAIADVSWTERGPWQVGGRTRAILWEPKGGGNYRVWAGSATGGLWYCDNIESNSASWQKVNDLMDNLSISSIIQDPSNSSHLLFSTGEYVGSGYRGMGVYESYNGGQTWAAHPATNNKYLGTIQKLIIDKRGGLWAATQWYGLCQYVSTTNSWQSVITATASGGQICYDAEMNGKGDIFAVVRRDSTGYLPVVYKYTFDVANNFYVSWNALSANFKANTTRVEIGVSANPSSNAVYLLGVNRNTGRCHQIAASFNGGIGFFDRNIPIIQDGNNTDTFTRDQGLYDLICQVDPTNEDIVYVGGINWCVSEDNGSTWSQLSWWTGGPTAQSILHADQHVFEFKPGSRQIALIGNDGGVNLSTNIHLRGGNAGFVTKNEGYRVTQFYHAANIVDNNLYFLGGTQDNGTWRFTAQTGAYPTQATGGDGAFCHIDHSDFNLQIGAYVYNDYRVSTDAGNSFVRRAFTGAGGQDKGLFINPTIFEKHSRKLFCSWSADTIMRYDDVASAGASITRMKVVDMDSGICTHLNTAPAENSDNIFLGTNKGRVLKIVNASTSAATQYIIMRDSVPYGWVSSVAQDYRNKDHLLVTFSNYGVVSVWETKDNGLNWKNVEGNLPDMPVRWGIFHPDDPNRALIATDLGVWSTDNLSSDTVDWDPNNNTLANVQVEMLRLGMEDRVEYDQYYNSSSLYLLAATFGRGLYTTSLKKIPNFKLNGTSTKSLYEKPTVNNGCVRYTDYKQYISMSATHPYNITVAIDTLPGFNAKRGKDFDILVNNNYTNLVQFDLNTNYPREYTIRVYDDGIINATKKFSLKLRVVDNTKEVIIDPYRNCDTFLVQDNDFEPNFTVTAKEIITPLTDGDETYDSPSPFTYSYKYMQVEFKYDSTFLLQAGLKPNVPISSFALKLNGIGSAIPAYNQVSWGVYGSYNTTSWPNIEGIYSSTVNNYNATSGWNTFNFASGVTWNRNQNFLINLYVNNSVCPNFNLGSHQIFGNTGFSFNAPNRTAYRYGNDNFSCGSPYNSNVFVATAIPQMKFTQLYYSEASNGMGDSAVEKLGPYETVYFKSSPTVVLAKVENLSGHDYQCVKLQIDRAGESTAQFWNNNPANYLLSKTFKVIPTVNNANGHYRITLYYSPEEARAWMQATGMPWTAIQVVKTPGEISSVNPGNVPSGVVVTNNISADSTGSGDGVTYRVVAEFFTGFSGFGIGLPGLSPLPLNWLSFDAIKEGNGVRLNWSTANETNVAGFRIERSSDGMKFSALDGFYTAKQEVLNNYSALHAAPQPGWNYYRVKQTDKDGKVFYSSVRSIYFDIQNKISVYPNPASDRIYISTVTKIASAQLIDARGTVIRMFNGNIQQIPVGGVPKGIYSLRVGMADKQVITVPVLIN